MFSTKAEYGVRVMVELARRAGERDGGNPVSLAEIAANDGLPLAYLEHLVARLRKAGLVDSRRGSRGGYMLARSSVVPAFFSWMSRFQTLTPNCVSKREVFSPRCTRKSV